MARTNPQIALVPMERPSFESIYLALAKNLAGRSTCKRLQVGTVIVSTDFRKVLSVGYNGGAAGQDNTCDTEVPGNCGCLHSENNAIINCDTPRYVEKYVFVTHSPCRTCCKMLINVGNVKRVYYEREYRVVDHLNMLRQAGIEVIRMDAACDQ